MGHFQRPIRLDELGNVWLRDILQPLLDLCHRNVPLDAIQRGNRTLATYEIQGHIATCE